MNKKEDLESIKKVIENAVGDYAEEAFLKDNNEISKVLNRLISFSKEYESKSFLMMVIGPTKSGKSTLVNLLARKIVSPTDMAECTIRPSIIAKHNIKDGEFDESKSIIVYKSKIDKEEEKVNCLDGILSNLKGTVTDDELKKMLTIEEHDFKDLNNIITPQKYVYDNTVITAIRTNPEKRDGDVLSDKAGEDTTQSTEDGDILSDNADGNSIFIVDMPGFDGAIVNQPTQDGTDKEDYLYRAITDRVDLIIFVQSSVGAVLDSTTRYFGYVKNSINKHVPVYLIHNEYDSTYWRTTSKKDIEEQQKEIYNAIKKEGINIESNHVKSANLGQAYDHLFKKGIVKEDYEKNLSNAFTNFVTIEKELRKEIIEQAEDSRLENCKNRIIETKKKLLDVLDAAITDLGKKEAERTNKEEDINNKIENLEIIVLRDRNNNDIKEQNKRREEEIEKLIKEKIDYSFGQHRAKLLNRLTSSEEIKKCFENAVEASEKNIIDWFKREAEKECEFIAEKTEKKGENEKVKVIFNDLNFSGLCEKTIDDKYMEIRAKTMTKNIFDKDKGFKQFVDGAIPENSILDWAKTHILGKDDIVTARTNNFDELSRRLAQTIYPIIEELATVIEREIRMELGHCLNSYLETLYSEEDAERKALLETFKEKIKGLRF